MRTILERQRRALRDHLSLTYVRYLTGEATGTPVRILVDGDEVWPWDPFCEDIGAERTLERTAFPVEIDGNPAELIISAHVLPPRTELDEVQRARAKLENRRQGIYVFRENRVISAGGWLGMWDVEPHFTLCRVELSFDHRLDDALQIDIKKSRIRMLADLQTFVRERVTPARNEAEHRYRANERTRITVESGDINRSSNTIISKHTGLSKAVLTPVSEDEAEVSNPRGKVTIRIPVLDDPSSDQVFVKAVEQLDDGVLWRPGLIDRRNAVLLNSGHPFYQKLYMLNRDNPVAIQGVNFLLWALAEAELYAMSEVEKEHMSAVRREVSRILRELSTELPEPGS